jgi:hypothetical protein
MEEARANALASSSSPSPRGGGAGDRGSKSATWKNPNQDLGSSDPDVALAGAWGRAEGATGISLFDLSIGDDSLMMDNEQD